MRMESKHTGSEGFRQIYIILKGLIQPRLGLYLNWTCKTETRQGSRRGSPCSIWGTQPREGCHPWRTLLHPQYHLLVHWRSWSAECKGAETPWWKGRKPLTHHLYFPRPGGAVITSFQGHCYCSQLLQLGITDCMVTCCYYQFTSAAPLTALSVSITKFWS